MGAGIAFVSSISTALVTAHYSAQEHARDRAEARAKDRKASVAATYIAALKVVRTYEAMALNAKPGEPAPPRNPELEREARDADALLALTGSHAALVNFARIVFFAQAAVGAAAERPKGSDAWVDISVLETRCQQFEQEARADMERQ